LWIEAIEQVVMLNYLSFINLCKKRKRKRKKKEQLVLTLVKGWRFGR